MQRVGVRPAHHTQSRGQTRVAEPCNGHVWRSRLRTEEDEKETHQRSRSRSTWMQWPAQRQGVTVVHFLTCVRVEGSPLPRIQRDPEEEEHKSQRHAPRGESLKFHNAQSWSTFEQRSSSKHFHVRQQTD
eukprot:380372-Rhodomonas_salina.9